MRQSSNRLADRITGQEIDARRDARHREAAEPSDVERQVTDLNELDRGRAWRRIPLDEARLVAASRCPLRTDGHIRTQCTRAAGHLGACE